MLSIDTNKLNCKYGGEQRCERNNTLMILMPSNKYWQSAQMIFFSTALIDCLGWMRIMCVICCFREREKKKAKSISISVVNSPWMLYYCVCELLCFCVLMTCEGFDLVKFYGFIFFVQKTSTVNIIALLVVGEWGKINGEIYFSNR